MAHKIEPKYICDAVVSADATGLTFNNSEAMYVVPLDRQALQRVARQIEEALKRTATK